jgi:hypothetical protein
MSFPAVEYSKCAFLSVGCVCMYLNVRVVLRGTLVKVKLYFYGGSTSHVRIALPLDAIIHVQLHLSQPPPESLEDSRYTSCLLDGLASSGYDGK